MTKTLLPKDLVLGALAAEFEALDGLLGQLDDGDWALPTPCPGWDVHAQVAHIIGTESMLAGIDGPGSDIDLSDRPHVRNDIGAFNEGWVVGLAGTPPVELLDRFRAVTAARLAALRGMDQASWDAEGFTPAGPDTYGRFMRIRVFDCWMHEQDIRDATGRPGHEVGPAVELALDEMVSVMGYVIGKRAGAPAGSSVTLALSGPASRTIHVTVDRRATVVDALPGPATATLRLPVGIFTRLGGGRIEPAAVKGHVTLEGDRQLGEAVLENLAFTI